MISFKRAEMNHDKVASPNKSYEASIYIAHNLNKLSSSVFCGLTSENVRPLHVTQFIMKYS